MKPNKNETLKLLSKTVEYKDEKVMYKENPFGLKANTLLVEHNLNYKFEFEINDEIIESTSTYFTSDGEYDFFANAYLVAKNSLKNVMRNALPRPNTKSNMFLGKRSAGINPREKLMDFTLVYTIKNEEFINQALENAFHCYFYIINIKSGEVLYKIDLQQ